LPRGRFRSEEELIRRIRRFFPAPGRGVAVPIGDDAALVDLPAPTRLAITTDQLVEGVHFLRKAHPPALLGEKALSVNLSDLAAMGAVPRWALLNLFLPRGMAADYLESVLRGMAGRARREKVSLVGGNITSARVFALDLTLMGALPRGVKPLLRSGARPGDTLFVSGPLGAARMGLSLLASGWRLGRSRPGRRLPSRVLRKHVVRALKSHLSPAPELKLGQLLARHALASAAMDLSDGLSLDLHRLCRASRIGARISAAAIPLDRAAVGLVGEKKALLMALFGGEDYRLLFTVAPGRRKQLGRLAAGHGLHPIGRCVPRRQGIKLEDGTGRSISLSPRGYDHLKRERRP